MLRKAVHAETAPAKINLALHVVGRRADGYHLLDSLVGFADTGDVLHMEWAEDTSLEITGPFAHRLAADDEENLVLRAISGLRQLLPPLPPLRLTLEKHLPVASGLGGGSADAAAALRGLIALSGQSPAPDALHELALSLGADVPVCLVNRACRMRGIGESLSPLETLRPMPAVLVNPGTPCDTATVFRLLALRDGLPGLSDGADDVRSLSGLRNDLEASARGHLPVIGDVIEALARSPGAWLARMSGSGASCFGLYGDHAEARAAAASISAAHPGWWVRAVTIR